MRDFTTQCLILMYNEFQKQGYKFSTFFDYCRTRFTKKFIIIRHDVDRNPKFALKIADVENSLGIRSTYYFRCKGGNFSQQIIERIQCLGHEIGYHYESLALTKGDFHKAIKIFYTELNKLRKIADVKTICAHGSPLSKWDSKKLWQKYRYEDFGILGEPYFSIDFNDILYLTDTGRKWSNGDFSVRDKVNSKFTLKFKSTFDILFSLKSSNFPQKIMINIHPHRWNDKYLLWVKELIWQNTKNIVKKYFLVNK